MELSPYEAKEGRNTVKAKEEKKPIPHAEISQKFDQDPPAIFCPACGVLILGHGEENICPHVLFTYLDMVGDFSAIAPAFEKAIRGIMEDDKVHDPVKAAMGLFAGKGSVFCLTVNFSGMGCGPVGGTLTAAFDYSPKT